MNRPISETTKFFLLMVFGLMIAFILSFAFNQLHIANSLFSMVFDLIWRLGLILICFFVAKIIYESLYDTDKS